MSDRAITAWSPKQDVSAETFHEGRGYINWRPRGSGDYLLIYTWGGSGRFTTPKGIFDTKVGDAVLYFPDQTQDYRTCPTADIWDHSWSHFRSKALWEIWLQWPLNPIDLRILSFEGRMRLRFSKALRETVDFSCLRQPQAQDLAANSLERALIWADVSRPIEARDPRVAKAISYLTSNSRAPFDAEVLAQQAHLSLSRLNHLFKVITGRTPLQFLESYRMQQAKTLLRVTELNVAEIAEQVGYADPFYFSRHFRRATGKSPKLFRQQYLDHEKSFQNSSTAE